MLTVCKWSERTKLPLIIPRDQSPSRVIYTCSA
ncbi:hypothetical protein T4C_10680 [Trichinella pseudospiralis]|uniref:Uncharacterized protein n=1 Tax=Trichinella pseudospiralis TaxID=6337 RepID=A0A0V1G831_TRIPS|nr:hypothetical protein T4C_10680 [Trichinella pseudospiralis]